MCDALPGVQRVSGSKSWSSSWLVETDQVQALQQALAKQLVRDG